MRSGERNYLIFKTTWGDLFKLFSPKLVSLQSDSSMKSYIASQILYEGGIQNSYNEYVVEQTFVTLRTQYELLGLITITIHAAPPGPMESQRSRDCSDAGTTGGPEDVTYQATMNGPGRAGVLPGCGRRVYRAGGRGDQRKRDV